MPPKFIPLAERIERYIVRRGPDECWGWTGWTNGKDRPMTSIGRQKIYVARYLLEQKDGRPLETGEKARHTCDNPSCINPNHLVRGTQKQNLADMVERGRSSTGTRHWNAKLTDEEVEEIRNSSESSRIAGARYNVNPSAIRKIRRGERWLHN